MSQKKSRENNAHRSAAPLTSEPVAKPVDKKPEDSKPITAKAPTVFKGKGFHILALANKKTATANFGGGGTFSTTNEDVIRILEQRKFEKVSSWH